MIRSTPWQPLVEKVRRFIQSPSIQGIPQSFDDLALEVHRFQIEHNLIYRNWVKNSEPRPPLTWQEIPPFPIRAFKDLQVSCIPPAERVGYFLSSGTGSDQRSHHYHHSETLELYEDSVRAGYDRFLKDRVDSHDWLFLTPSKAASPHSSLVHMFDSWASTHDRSEWFGLVDSSGVWQVEWSRLFDRMIQATSPLFLCGTAFHWVHLIDELTRRKSQLLLPPGSLLLETGGYKGQSRTLTREELYTTIGNHLGLKPHQILSEYGMSELSSQGYSLQPEPTPALQGYHFPPWMRVDVVSPEDGVSVREGDVGLLVFCDLANVGSVSVLQTEDLGRIDPCTGALHLCGRASADTRRGCSLMTA